MSLGQAEHDPESGSWKVSKKSSLSFFVAPQQTSMRCVMPSVSALQQKRLNQPDTPQSGVVRISLTNDAG